jgi:hypothetical protein
VPSFSMPKDPTGMKSHWAQRKPPAPKEAPAKATESFAGRCLQVEWDNPRTNRLLDWWRWRGVTGTTMRRARKHTHTTRYVAGPPHMTQLTLLPFSRQQGCRQPHSTTPTTTNPHRRVSNGTKPPTPVHAMPKTQQGSNCQRQQREQGKHMLCMTGPL